MRVCIQNKDTKVCFKVSHSIMDRTKEPPLAAFWGRIRPTVSTVRHVNVGFQIECLDFFHHQTRLEQQSILHLTPSAVYFDYYRLTRWLCIIVDHNHHQCRCFIDRHGSSNLFDSWSKESVSPLLLTSSICFTDGRVQETTSTVRASCCQHSI